MLRRSVRFVFSSVLVWVSSNHVIVVDSRNALCGENRCIRIGDNDIKYNTCGSSCTTTTCTNFDFCTSSNTFECGNDACVSTFYLEARADYEKRDYCDPCCSSCFDSDPCFSAFASTDVLSKGRTLIKDLQVGDRVLTASGGYKQVFTLDHKHPNKAAEFLQIYTSQNKNKDASPLEITKNHLVFLHNKNDPVPAGQVQVGDALQLPTDQPATVTKISTVIRNGLWNPITEDGTIVVDGIITSTYTALDITTNVEKHSTHLQLGGYKIMSKHHFMHLLLTPYRTLCMSTSSSLCQPAETEEFSPYSQLGLQLLKLSHQLPPITQSIIVLGAILVFACLHFMFTNPLAVLAMLSALAGYHCYPANK